MSEFKVGDTVMDLIWDGAFSGRVAQVFSNGGALVRWSDGSASVMAPHQIAHLPSRKEAA